MVVSGVGALGARRSAITATLLGAGGAVAGSVIGLVAALGIFFDPSGAPQALRLAWDVPFGPFYLQADALSSFFLIPILGLSGLAAVYGAEYLWSERKTKSLGAPWFFYNLLVASMMLVVLARNGVLFLVAWEVMALTSFFLVTFEDEQESVRRAGWTYLVATHLGTVFLFVMFILLGRQSGSMDFASFKAGGAAGVSSGVLFVLALVGFGSKAGIMPLHVWLPEAHPAAPSHVSAVMSGVMIKTGIYGLLRMLTILGPPPAWWAWTLIGVGAVSGIMGVLFAVAQNDLKRLLAYSSVENIGIILLGLGIGVLGLSTGQGALAALGFAGALLHVLNHAAFKGLLFLGAGSVMHGAHTRQMDLLGGLLKRMPWTGPAFLVGAAAICGLPPFNGFVSEFFIYAGGFYEGEKLVAWNAAAAVTVVASLALIGGLAVACFTKAFGIIFLGEPRSEQAAHAHEPGLAMRLPMIILAVICAAIGLLAPLVARAIAPVVAVICGGPAAQVQTHLSGVGGAMAFIVTGSAGLLALVTVLAVLRRGLLAGRSVEKAGTWDCGYARPAAKMQYTASSYAQPLTHLFSNFLRTRNKLRAPQGYFPEGASLSTRTPDVFSDRAYRPIFKGVGRTVSWLRRLQAGSVHLYILYIALTLVILLIWKLG